MTKDVGHRTPLFAANWKMNKLGAEVPEFVTRLSAALADMPSAAYEVAVFPPYVYLPLFQQHAKGKRLAAGGQNCGTAKSGAFTGEIAPAMLKDVGAEWVIVGHSERRHVYKEDDALILARAKAALDEGLKVIYCVGEKLEERKGNRTFEVLESQLAPLKSLTSGWERLVLAYEPVWAIGTGEVATPEQAQEVHLFLRGKLAEKGASTRILYGGSVKPDNSGQLMAQADVDGLLVGGASLDPAQFAGVVKNGLVLK